MSREAIIIEVILGFGFLLIGWIGSGVRDLAWKGWRRYRLEEAKSDLATVEMVRANPVSALPSAFDVLLQLSFATFCAALAMALPYLIGGLIPMVPAAIRFFAGTVLLSWSTGRALAQYERGKVMAAAFFRYPAFPDRIRARIERLSK
jgi:hypothetical protein